jgi:hypothetical protein
VRGTGSPPPPGIEYALKMPEASLLTRILLLSAENDAPRKFDVRRNSSIE